MILLAAPFGFFSVFKFLPGNKTQLPSNLPHFEMCLVWKSFDSVVSSDFTYRPERESECGRVNGARKLATFVRLLAAASILHLLLFFFNRLLESHSPVTLENAPREPFTKGAVRI